MYSCGGLGLMVRLVFFLMLSLSLPAWSDHNNPAQARHPIVGDTQGVEAVFTKVSLDQNYEQALKTALGEFRAGKDKDLSPLLDLLTLAGMKGDDLRQTKIIAENLFYGFKQDVNLYQKVVSSLSVLAEMRIQPADDLRSQSLKQEKNGELARIELKRRSQNRFVDAMAKASGWSTDLTLRALDEIRGAKEGPERRMAMAKWFASLESDKLRDIAKLITDRDNLSPQGAAVSETEKLFGSEEKRIASEMKTAAYAGHYYYQEALKPEVIAKFYHRNPPVSKPGVQLVNTIFGGLPGWMKEKEDEQVSLDVLNEMHRIATTHNVEIKGLADQYASAQGVDKEATKRTASEKFIGMYPEGPPREALTNFLMQHPATGNPVPPGSNVTNYQALHEMIDDALGKKVGEATHLRITNVSAFDLKKIGTIALNAGEPGATLSRAKDQTHGQFWDVVRKFSPDGRAPSVSLVANPDVANRGLGDVDAGAAPPAVPDPEAASRQKHLEAVLKSKVALEKHGIQFSLKDGVTFNKTVFSAADLDDPDLQKAFDLNWENDPPVSELLKNAKRLKVINLRTHLLLPPDANGNVRVMSLADWNESVNQSLRSFDNAADEQRRQLLKKAKEENEWSLWQAPQALAHWTWQAYSAEPTEEEKTRLAFERRLTDARQELRRLGAQALAAQKVHEERMLSKLSRPNDDTALLNSGDNLGRSGAIMTTVSFETLAVMALCKQDPTNPACTGAIGALAGTALESARQVARVQYDGTQDLIDTDKIAETGGWGAVTGMAVGTALKALPASLTTLGLAALGGYGAKTSASHAYDNLTKGRPAEGMVDVGEVGLSLLGIKPALRAFSGTKGAAAPSGVVAAQEAGAVVKAEGAVSSGNASPAPRGASASSTNPPAPRGFATSRPARTDSAHSSVGEPHTPPEGLPGEPVAVAGERPPAAGPSPTGSQTTPSVVHEPRPQILPEDLNEPTNSRALHTLLEDGLSSPPKPPKTSQMISNDPVASAEVPKPLPKSNPQKVAERLSVDPNQMSPMGRNVESLQDAIKVLRIVEPAKFSEVATQDPSRLLRGADQAAARIKSHYAERLNGLVAEGKLSEPQKNRLLGKLKEELTQVVEIFQDAVRAQMSGPAPFPWTAPSKTGN
jgi:hypothetical protein